MLSLLCRKIWKESFTSKVLMVLFLVACMGKRSDICLSFFSAALYERERKRQVLIADNVFSARKHIFGYSSVALTSASVPDLH